MREPRESSFALYVGLALMLAFIIVPRLAAQDAPPVGEWTGTLNPGGQAKKHVVVHISAEQDGSLRGTIDYGCLEARRNESESGTQAHTVALSNDFFLNATTTLMKHQGFRLSTLSPIRVLIAMGWLQK